MAKVTDPHGVPWSVRRRWFFEPPDWLDGGTSDIGYLLAAFWPCWLIAHWLGWPWVIVIKRAGNEQCTERVRGWVRSQRRIQQITQSAADGTWQRRPGQPKHLV
jgi:hypothetical protein